MVFNKNTGKRMNIKISLIYIFISLTWGVDIVFKINGVGYSENFFFNSIPRGDWENINGSQRVDVLNDFINRLTVNEEAVLVGFLEQPFLLVKIRNRVNQLIVNSAYEYFVALPLIDPEYLELTKINLKNQVSVKHLLIGYNGCQLPVTISRSKDSASRFAEELWRNINSGGSFGELVLEYSDDPSVKKNEGALGWLNWGQTIPAIQNTVFSLEVGGVSKPILTDFGYHILLLSDKRESPFSKIDSIQYYSKCLEISMNSVSLDVKRSAAENFDNNILESSGVVFNYPAVLKILKTLTEENEKNKIVAGGKRNLLSALNKIGVVGVVCVYNGNGYGLKWFSNHFSNIPASRLPAFTSVENITSAIRTAILQKIALNKTDEIILNYGAVIEPKLIEMKMNLVYDSYLKYIVNNIEQPAADSVRSYYELNKDTKYIEYDLVEVRELKVVSGSLSDSLYSLLDGGYDFLNLAKKFSLTNPTRGGLIAPFTSRRYGPMGEKAFGLGVGEYSNPIQNLDGSWSIILLESKLEKQYIPLERVYSKIEAQMKKELQSFSKENLFSNLNNKFNVWVNPDFIAFE